MSLHKPLYTTFLLTQLYALTLHFPHPPTGLVHPTHLQALKLLSLLSTATSLAPTFSSSTSNPPATFLYAASLTLFLWTAATTRPRKLSVIYGRVTPRYVLSGGPYAWVRHPTYVSYALGWMGAGAQVLLCGDLEGAGWVSWRVRVGVMLGCVVGLCWLYRVGAVLEERQFLQGGDTVVGEKVDEKVRMEYLAYVRSVRARWVPGVV